MNLFPPNTSVTFASGVDLTATKADVRILHYNDVYHLEQASAEPVGGYARFISVVNEYRQVPETADTGLVTVFSGDAFNPSLESSVTKGEHMVPVLNQIGTDVACVGNHDLDFGVAQFAHLASKCAFPWLLTNVFDPALGSDVPLGNAKKTHWHTTPTGLKIAFVGLGEREWLDTINSLPPNIIYKSASATAYELVPQLREQGADLVICVSHQREPNDNKLAEQTAGLFDLILGGHDHYYAHSRIKGTHVLRSGTDFKNLSYIEGRRRRAGDGDRDLDLSSDGKREWEWDWDIVRRDVYSNVRPDPAASALVDRLTASLKKNLARPIGWTAVPLDARFTTVRTGESNIGNLVCDIMRGHYDADCCIMAAGTVRSDTVYPPGVLLVKDITNCFPFEDPAILIRVTGRAIWAALENGVSQYPALEGRFPQVSNIRFRFDLKRPAGQRIVEATIGGEPVDLERKYKLATRGYMGRGKDGYEALLVKSEGGEAEEIVDEENGIILSAMLRQYFMGLRTVGKWRHLSSHWEKVADKLLVGPTPTLGVAEKETEHRQQHRQQRQQYQEQQETGVSKWAEWLEKRVGWKKAPVDEEKSVTGLEASEREADIEDEDDDSDRIDGEILLLRKFFAKWAKKAGVKTVLCDEFKKEDLMVDWTRVIAPKLEGRIVMIE